MLTLLDSHPALAWCHSMLPKYARARADINRTLGFVGSVALAVGGVAAGALPVHDPFGSWPVIHGLRAFPLAGTALTYLGLTLLTGAWLRMRATGGRARDMVVTFAWWAAPLVVAPPLYSRDIYSYVAQGAMVRHGVDAYAWGPAALAGRPGAYLAANVPDIWQHTPAPYGPVFLRLASGVVGLTGDHTVLATLGMRLLALVGVGLIVACLPPLAARCGVPASTAVWLAVLNPLVLIHLVAGAHNDALMIGLMTAGLLAAVRGRHQGSASMWLAGLRRIQTPPGTTPVPSGYNTGIQRRPARPQPTPGPRLAPTPTLTQTLVAVPLICGAALIKAPALLALLFLVHPLALKLSGRWRLPRAAALTAAVAAGCLGVLTAAMRLGSGWVGALATPATVRNGLSLSTDVGMAIGRVFELLGWGTMPATVAATRSVGWVLGAVLAGLALFLVRRPVRALGLALSAIVLCGPIVHPWYLLWGLIPLAAGAADDPRVRRAVIVVSVGLSFFLMPYGGGPTPSAVIAGLVGLAVGAAFLLLNRTLVESRGNVPQRQMVAVHTQTADHAGGDRGDDRMVPELLARMDVGDVHLDERSAQHRTGVAQRDRVVRPRRRVEHNGGALVGGGVEPSEHHRLVVGLADLDLESELLAGAHASGGKLGVADEAVDVGLAGAEPAQVRPVEHVDLHKPTSS
jgi:hypothetical protein